MIKKFDHVCMAVEDAGETVALLSKLFGFEIADSHAEPQAGFHSTLISKNDVTLELIEPVGPQGMIQRFIEKRGSALHHISIQVADLSEEIARLKQLGVQFTSEQAADVAGSKLIFIHPRSTNGLLIELIQRE